MTTQAVDIRFPARFVVFRYKEAPKEWHVTCLEAHAFGSGSTVDAAFADLFKTVAAQFQEASTEGFDALFEGAIDDEWVEAYRRGKHPALEDVVVSLSAEGEIGLVISPKVRARLSGAVRVSTPGASRGDLQPA